MGRIRNTIELAKTSWGVLQKDRELVVLPVLSFLGAAVLQLLHHRRGEGHSFAEGQQEVTGVTRSNFHQVSVLAEAEDVLIQNDLYTLRHGTGTKDGGGCDRPRYDVACC